MKHTLNEYERIVFNKELGTLAEAGCSLDEEIKKKTIELENLYLSSDCINIKKYRINAKFAMEKGREYVALNVGMTFFGDSVTSSSSIEEVAQYISHFVGQERTLNNEMRCYKGFNVNPNYAELFSSEEFSKDKNIEALFATSIDEAMKKYPDEEYVLIKLTDLVNEVIDINDPGFFKRDVIPEVIKKPEKPIKDDDNKNDTSNSESDFGLESAIGRLCAKAKRKEQNKRDFEESERLIELEYQRTKKV